MKGNTLPNKKGNKKMRITKVVKEYIEERITEKVWPKYELEKIEAERQLEVKNKFFEELAEELEAIATERMEKFLAENPFLERSEKQNISTVYYSSVNIIDRHLLSSVHNWKSRAKDEISNKTRNIIVALELGGTKEDLERMISEI